MKDNELDDTETNSITLPKKIDDYVSKYDYTFRICIVGDANVGKTSILMRYCDNVFKESYVNTIGVDFRVLTLKYNNTMAKIHVWDTAGQERFKSISVNYFRASHGFIFVYDVTNKQSFLNLSNWIDTAFNSNRNTEINFLVGNKNDMKNREVEIEEAKDFAISRNMTYLETSALNSFNINKLFEFFGFKLI